MFIVYKYNKQAEIPVFWYLFEFGGIYTKLISEERSEIV